MTQKVTSNSIESVDASKLSGDHTNATDGRNLTNINDGIIESPNDPTPSSNPHGGLGTLWVNYTSGEMYNCINAATNSNYWKNVGGQSGDIFYSYTGADGQIGTQYGYCGFGENNTGQVIERFAFSSSTSGSNFLYPSETAGWSLTSTTSSTTHGYAAGFTTYNSATGHNRFSKFAFSNGSYSGGIDTLSYTPTWPGGCQSATHGFILGGLSCGGRFDRYQFSNDQDQGQWGSLQQTSLGSPAGSNDGTHGYWSGGSHPQTDYMGRFAFDTQNSQANVGTLGTANYDIAAVNNTTHTYYAGSAAPHTSNIKKFAFASNVSISSHGVLHANIWNGYLCGHSNTTHGYWSGGYYAQTKIQRFAWSSNTTAAQVGSLTNSRYRLRGWQK